jgi:hypothetical protein
MVLDGAYLKYAFDHFNSNRGHQPFHYMEETAFPNYIYVTVFANDDRQTTKFTNF